MGVRFNRLHVPAVSVRALLHCVRASRDSLSRRGATPRRRDALRVPVTRPAPVHGGPRVKKKKKNRLQENGKKKGKSRKGVGRECTITVYPGGVAGVILNDRPIGARLFPHVYTARWTPSFVRGPTVAYTALLYCVRKSIVTGRIPLIGRRVVYRRARRVER